MNAKPLQNADAMASPAQRMRFPFTKSSKSAFNPSAASFDPQKQNHTIEDFPLIAVGPSRVPVNENVWRTIASNRLIPELPYGMPRTTRQAPPSLPAIQQPQPMFMAPSNVFAGYNHPSPFEDDYSRNCVFTRDFGPVAIAEGFVELRLREKISILMTLDKSILIQNPKSKVKIAINHSFMASSMEHPNGKVVQDRDRVDIMSYDGSKKLNNYVRYAKMWDKGISLSADGCALIYLVDTAGTRTTSDPVNKEIQTDYCWQTFITNSRFGRHLIPEANAAAQNYHFYTKDDGTQVFEILGFIVHQTPDGMVRVARGNNRMRAHTSPTNGSATMSTPFIHTTASMGQSSHLFVRRDERRMHFDGTSFVVRNAGHSSGFDQDNNLRVY